MYKTGLIEIEAALAVARLNGFRPAAAELGMSTSALSSAIAGLEARLKVRLFNRTTRSVSLTEAGRLFIERVRPAVTEISQAMAEASSRAGSPAGTLRINSSLGAARMVIEPLVLAYLQRYPEMNVDMVTEARNVDIVADGFDAGLRPVEAVPAGMVRVPFGSKIRMAVVGAPAYFEKHPVPLAPTDLLEHECIRIRSPNGALSAWEFSQQDKNIEMAVPGRLVVDAPALMLDAVRRGWGLAYLAEWYVIDDLGSGRLVQALQDWTPAFSGLALYYPANRHIPASLRAFIDLIRERMPFA
jgi:DNA-binding transcriptional LysR family regulator